MLFRSHQQPLIDDYRDMGVELQIYLLKLKANFNLGRLSVTLISNNCTTNQQSQHNPVRLVFGELYLHCLPLWT